MNKEELYTYLLDSNFFKRWHWFRYHFEHPLVGLHHPLSESVLEACLACEPRIPGFAKGMIDALADISGKERYEPHYEQLLQRLAELHIIRQLLTFDWPSPVSFYWEPTPKSGSKKNPEIIVESGGYQVGVEVKAPSLLNHIRQRSSNPTQVPARAFSRDVIKQFARADEGITFPRDNPIKDFLMSAEDKFYAFKQEDSEFYSILVIVWDDYIYEPISSLSHPSSGLFTQNSFAKDASGQYLKFPSVDAVILVSHLHQLIRATRDEPLATPCRHPLDYGKDNEFPMKAIVVNPCGTDIPDTVLECFQAFPPSSAIGAEYMPQDWILWLKR